MKKQFLTILIGAMAFTSQVGLSKTTPSKDIVETAVSAGSFKTLAAALQAADLVDALKSNGPFTVFAPTDKAFAKLPKQTLRDLLKPENKKKLQAILKYHVVSGQVGLSDALAAKKAKTLQGDSVNIDFKGGKVRINNAQLLNADLKTSNGVIHVIDTVLLPPAKSNSIAGVAKKAGNFNTLLAAVDAAGLTPILTGKNKVTVLAPTDAAFKALPSGTVETLLKPENRDKLAQILSLHVIKGSVSAGTALNAKIAKSVSNERLKFEIANGIFKVNGVRIVTTDIKCDNGVIHVLDTVLLPKANKVSNMSPAKCIENAIHQGVPAFNNGHPGRCADIYMKCVEMLASDGRVDAKTRKMLAAHSSSTMQWKCTTSKAWALRRALDSAYQAVNASHCE